MTVELSFDDTKIFRYDLIRKPGEKAGEIFVSVIFRDVELSGEVRRNSSPSTSTPVSSQYQLSSSQFLSLFPSTVDFYSISKPLR